MKKMLIRSVFFFLLAIVQSSILNVMFVFFGIGMAPIVLFSYAVAHTYRLGFHEAVPALLLFGVFSDILTSERIGTGVLFAVGLSYAVSFFSKRFTLDHRAIAVVVGGVLVGASALLFPVIFGILFDRSSLIVEFPSAAYLLKTLAIGMAAFPLVSLVERWLEDRLWRFGDRI